MTKPHSELLHRPTTQDKPYVGLGPRPTSWLQRFPSQPQGLSIFTRDCESLPGPPILLQTLAVGATGGQASGGPTGAGSRWTTLPFASPCGTRRFPSRSRRCSLARLPITLSREHTALKTAEAEPLLECVLRGWLTPPSRSPVSGILPHLWSWRRAERQEGTHLRRKTVPHPRRQPAPPFNKWTHSHFKGAFIFSSSFQEPFESRS